MEESDDEPPSDFFVEPASVDSLVLDFVDDSEEFDDSEELDDSEEPDDSVFGGFFREPSPLRPALA